MIIDCNFQSPWWDPQDELVQHCTAAVEAAAGQLEELPQPECEVSIVFSNDEQVRLLNRKWRGRDSPTNVLSFVANEGNGPSSPALGDIVLARQTIEREAAAQGKTRNHHLIHLVVHGFLHLMGHDHQNDRQALEMERLETDILSNLGIDDPYAPL